MDGPEEWLPPARAQKPAYSPASYFSISPNGSIIADRRFEPAGFRLALGLKDVSLALDAAQESAVPMPLASLIRDNYLNAVAHGHADADWSAVAEVAVQNAGLTNKNHPVV